MADIKDLSALTPVTISRMAALVNDNPDENDIIVFDQSVPLAHESEFPLRIDALVMALCLGGHGKIGIDLREYEIAADTLVVIQPRNHIFLTEYSPDLKVMTVACSNHLVNNVLPKLTEVLPLLLMHRNEPVVRIAPDETARLAQLWTLLRDTLLAPPSPFKRNKVLCLLQAALYDNMDIRGRHAESTQTVPQSRREEIMARFLLEVSRNFRSHRDVSFYSDKLCITPKHLSAVVKSISGRTAGEWIDNHVVMEAQVLLKTTDLTIQEVSDRLNFANQSFFGKYFKHLTGLSPSAYRKTRN